MSIFGKRNKEQNGGVFDFYETPEIKVQEIFDNFILKNISYSKTILEPCNGEGSISNFLKKQGYIGIETLDIDPNRKADKYCNFLEQEIKDYYDLVITNPPYKGNEKGEFIKKSLDVVVEGGFVVMFLKMNYLESVRRYNFFKENNIYELYACHKRANILGGTGVFYGWFVWKKGYKGNTTLFII